MSRYGKYNLLGMLSLPVVTMLSVMLATMNGVFNAYGATYLYLFAINLMPMLFGGLVSWLLLRKATTDKGRLIAITPTLVPAGIGSVWYLWRAMLPAEVGPGAEYIAAPQYLLFIWVPVVAIIAWIFGRATRSV